MRPPCQLLHDPQRQDGSVVDERIAAVVDPGDSERSLAEAEHPAGAEMQPPSGTVAEQCVVAFSTAALDHHGPQRGELAGHVAEDEQLARAEEEDPRGPRDSAFPRDVAGEALREKRLREIGRPSLEEAEVGAADVDELRGGSLRAVGDREQRHDQADAHGNAGGRQRRPHRTSPQVSQHKPGPGHRGHLR